MKKKLAKTQLLKYTVIYTPEKEGGFTVTVPSLPGCITYGKNVKEATKMAKDAVLLYLQSLQAHNEPIPTEANTLITSINLELPATHA